MRFLKYFIYLLLLVFSILFFTQNSSVLSQELTFQLNLYAPGFQWETFSMPLFFVLLVFFLLGSLATIMPMFIDRCRLSYRLRRASKEINNKEKELKAYRQLPITGLNDQGLSPAEEDKNPATTA